MKRMMRKLSIAILAVLSLFVFAACGEEGMHQVSRISWDGFDTQSRIIIYYYGRQSNSREREYVRAIEEGFDIIMELDGIFNRFREGTDVWRVNNAGGEWVEVSDHMIAALQYSEEFRQMTGGGFDVTIGSVSQFWGFSGAGLERGSMPTRAQLDEYLPAVGTAVEINGNMVRLTHPNARLDLGSTAKGYATDVVAAHLAAQGLVGIVYMGGDNTLFGQRPDGGAWLAGTNMPYTSHLSQQERLMGHFEFYGSMAVLSSAIDERYFMIDDEKFHHILDVNTGMPIRNNIVSVAVVAETGVLGEGITTAIFALGVVEGMALVKRTPNVEAVVFLNAPTLDGRMKIVSSGLHGGGTVTYVNYLEGLDFNQLFLELQNEN